MTHCVNARRRLSLALVAALTFQGTPLLASGFQLLEQNASGLGTAHAGDAAAAEDASTIFFNPAGMTRLKGKQLVLAVNGVDIKTQFADTASSRPFLPPGLPVSAQLGSLGGDAGGWAAVPNGYFSWQAADKVWIGLGVNVPFGLPTDWQTDFMGRFHALKSDVKTYNVNPNLAVKLSDHFSLAGGASWQRLTATLSQGVPYGGIAIGAAGSVPPPYTPVAVAGILGQLGPSGLYTEGTSQVKGDSSAWGWNVGAMLSGEKARLGLSYRSKINHIIEGDLTFTGAPTFSESVPLPLGAILNPLGAGLNAALKSGPAQAKIELPDTFSVAGAVDASDKIQLLADWTWTGWSSIQALTISRTSGTVVSSVPLTFKDTWRAGLGVNWQVSKPAKLRFGTAYDTAPVQDQYRTPRLPDQDRVWASAGLQLKAGKSGAFDLGYSHIFVKDASSNLPNQTTATSPPKGNLVGTYTQSVNIVAAQYTISF
jgi:long-chain fatty acid transport protein